MPWARTTAARGAPASQRYEAMSRPSASVKESWIMGASVLSIGGTLVSLGGRPAPLRSREREDQLRCRVVHDEHLGADDVVAEGGGDHVVEEGGREQVGADVGALDRATDRVEGR